MNIKQCLEKYYLHSILFKALSEKDCFFTFFAIAKFRKLFKLCGGNVYQRERLKALTFLQF